MLIVVQRGGAKAPPHVKEQKMNKPFVLIAEDKWIGRFDSHEAADMAGMASGKGVV